MSPEKQRVAIAKACGIEVIQTDSGLMMSRPYVYNSTLTLQPAMQLVPNYPYDLNAMHEAEKILKGSNIAVYLGILSEIYDPKDVKFTLSCVFATASQRAEAFLRTIGKWEDSSLSPEVDARLRYTETHNEDAKDWKGPKEY